MLKRTGFSHPIKLPEGYTGLPNSEVTCVGACSADVWDVIYKSAVGNALVAIIGTVPGYWFTVAFVDKWGRIPIQYMGFAMMTTLLVILAAAYPQVRFSFRQGGCLFFHPRAARLLVVPLSIFERR